MPIGQVCELTLSVIKNHR